jgi:hypothetical protein
MFAIQNDLFDEYHLILPNYGGERSNAYAFLNGRKNVFVYDKYHEVVTKKVLNTMHKKRTFFGIDDASSAFSTVPDETFRQLATCNEHYKKCCVYICVHSSKRVLSPIIRQQITALFLYKISNMKLLKDIYDEYFAIGMEWKDFYDTYQSNVLNNERNALMYSLEGHHELEGIKNWTIMSLEMKGGKKEKEVKHIDPRKIKLETSVETMNEKREMKEKLLPQKAKGSIFSRMKINK